MKSRGNSPKMQRNTSPRLALEPRIVFDAAIGATAADAFDRYADRNEYVPPATSQPVRGQRTETAAQPPKPAPLLLDEMSAVARPSGTTEAAARVEIIFVDSAVRDIQSFLPVLQQFDPGRRAQHPK